MIITLLTRPKKNLFFMANSSSVPSGYTSSDGTYFDFNNGIPVIPYKNYSDEEIYYNILGDNYKYNYNNWNYKTRISNSAREDFINTMRSNVEQENAAAQAMYKNWYDSTAQQMLRNTEAGYNPYYTGSFQNSALASTVKPASASSGAADVSARGQNLNAVNAIFGNILDTVSAAYGLNYQKAQTDYIQSQAEQVRALTPFKATEAAAKAQRASNDAIMSDIFSGNYDLDTSVDDFIPFNKKGSDYAFNSGKTFVSNIPYDLVRDKKGNLLGMRYIPHYDSAIASMNALGKGYDLEAARINSESILPAIAGIRAADLEVKNYDASLYKQLQEHLPEIVSSMVSKANFDAAYYTNQADWIKSDKNRTVVLQYLNSLMRFVSSVR